MKASPPMPPTKRTLWLRLRRIALRILEANESAPDGLVEARESDGTTEVIVAARPAGTEGGVLATIPPMYLSQLERAIIEKIGHRTLKQIAIARAVGMVEASDTRKAKTEFRIILNNLIQRGLVIHDDDEGYSLSKEALAFARTWGIVDSPTISADPEE